MAVVSVTTSGLVTTPPKSLRMNDLMSSSRIVARADDEPDDPCGEQRAGRGRYAEEPDSRSQHRLGCRVNRPIVAPSAGHSHKSCCGTATLGAAPAALGRRRNVADKGPRTGTRILHVDRDRGRSAATCSVGSHVVVVGGVAISKSTVGGLWRPGWCGSSAAATTISRPGRASPDGRWPSSPGWRPFIAGEMTHLLTAAARRELSVVAVAAGVADDPDGRSALADQFVVWLRGPGRRVADRLGPGKAVTGDWTPPATPRPRTWSQQVVETMVSGFRRSRMPVARHSGPVRCV
jgi:hypothetical protein